MMPSTLDGIHSILGRTPLKRRVGRDNTGSNSDAKPGHSSITAVFYPSSSNIKNERLVIRLGRLEPCELPL